MAAREVSVAIRLILAVGGSYGVSAGLTALAAVALPMTTGIPRSEAVVLASMLASLVYLTLLIWAFAARRLTHLCVVFAAVGTASWGGALGLVRMIG